MKRFAAPHTAKLDVLSRFAGDVAHDVNNLLSSIEARTAQAVRQLAAGDITPLQLQHCIVSLTQQGAQMTRQLLAFSQQKIGVEGPLDLAALLRAMENELKALAGTGIGVDLDIQPSTVIAAREHVAQVVLNLARNAVDAMPQGGRLRLSCAGGRLTMRDDGHGIPPHLLPRIFEPFFSTKTTPRAGLGLPVVYGILEQLGAQIAVESLPRRGTTVTVLFRTTGQQAEAVAEGNVVYLAGNPPPPVQSDILRKILQRAQEHHDKNGDDPDFL